eukprot:2393082-Pyramimonas_sp.AAC.1
MQVGCQCETDLRARCGAEPGLLFRCAYACPCSEDKSACSQTDYLAPKALAGVEATHALRVSAIAPGEVAHPVVLDVDRRTSPTSSASRMAGHAAE